MCTQDTITVYTLIFIAGYQNRFTLRGSLKTRPHLSKNRETATKKKFHKLHEETRKKLQKNFPSPFIRREIQKRPKFRLRRDRLL